MKSEGGLKGHFREMARSGELIDRMALAFNSLRMNPDPNIAAQARADIRGHAQRRKRNRTLEYMERWVDDNPGYKPVFDAATAGVISPTEAFKVMMEDRLGKGPTKGVNVGGRLVDPYTGNVMADFSEDDQPYTQAGKLSADLRSGLINEEQYRAGLARLDNAAPSSAEAAIGRIMEVPNPQTGQPFTREQAIQISDLNTVSRNPQNGEVQLINKATSSPIGGTPQPAPPPMPEPRAPDSYGNVAGALGIGGIAANTVNTLGDSLGLGLAFPEAEKAESALRNLSTQTMLTMSGEWSGRPSNLTRERIEALTVKPNEFSTGRGGALIKLQDMQEMISNAMASAQSVEAGQFSPAQKTQARQKANELSGLLQQYEAIIANLQGGKPNGNRGRTSGGINWSVDQ